MTNDDRYKRVSQKLKQLWKEGHYKNRKIPKNSGQFKKGQTAWNKGLKGYLKGREITWGDKISKALKGKGKGRRLSLKTRLKMSKSAPKGANHHNWNGGISTERRRAYTTAKYQEWREAVFKRDDYTCQKCRAKSSHGKMVYLEADHIKEWTNYPKLRYKISNGQTLCLECHKLKTKNYMKGNQNAKK